MNPTSRDPVAPASEPPVSRATYVLDREGRIIETNETIADFSFCQRAERRGARFDQRIDPDSARILQAFFKDPGKTLSGHVDFCFMRGDGDFFPTFLSIKALSDDGTVVGFVVHVEPAGNTAGTSPQPAEGGRRKP